MTSRLVIKTALAVGVAFATLSPVVVLANFYDGNVLYQKCSDDTAFAQGVCLGYVGGIADSMGSDDAQANRSQCIDKEATMGQLRDVAIAYLRDHPAERHLSAASLVRFALRKGFCPASLT